MENVISIANFTFSMIQTIFNFFMSSWVTAVFPIGMIILFILNLVIASSSGDDGDK